MQRFVQLLANFLLVAFALQTTSQVWALPTGNEFQRLSPSASGVDFITTESSYPTQMGTVIFATSIDYAMHILPVVYEEGVKEEVSLDTLLSSQHSIAVGFTKDFEFQFKLPIILRAESLDHPSDKGEITNIGFTYVGGGGKYRFFRRAAYEMTLGAEVGADLMQSNPYTGVGMLPLGSSVYLASTANYNPLIFGVNVGYKFRMVGQPLINDKDLPAPIQPIPHTLLFSTALALNSGIFGSFVAEIYGSHGFPLSPVNNTDRMMTSAEFLVGFC